MSMLTQILWGLLFICAARVMAQPPMNSRVEQIPEGSVPMETNINQNSYPRLMSDNSIMFRLIAPEAQSVKVDICGVKYDMEKDDNGVWTGRTAPQVPGFHYYSLIVDGVSVNDPASETFYGCGRMMSAVDVPEDGADFMQIRDVPHGKVSTLNYFSKVTNSWRTLCVYTPPTYDKDVARRYPVVYIQHGGGEDHRGWVQQGGKFRTIADRDHRAMCGLSMGGGQSFYIGLRGGLDTFCSVGIFSTGAFGGIVGAAPDIDKEVPGILSKSAEFNERLDVLLITCGEQDPRIIHNKRVAEQMRDHGLKVEFKSFPGDHEWQPWRKSIHYFAQLIFKK